MGKPRGPEQHRSNRVKSEEEDAAEFFLQSLTVRAKYLHHAARAGATGNVCIRGSQTVLICVAVSI